MTLPPTKRQRIPVLPVLPRTRTAVTVPIPVITMRELVGGKEQQP